MGVKDRTSIPFYQVDAFTSKVFSGNPAGVCLLEEPLEDEVMQQIAAENNLAETAFIRIDLKPYQIRWFTPTVEVDLCGHATLASAYVLFNEKNVKDIIRFQSLRSGKLIVTKNEDRLTLDFPIDKIIPIGIKNEWIEAIGSPILEAYAGRTDLILRVENEAVVKAIQPDFENIKRWPYVGVIVTAKGTDVDFVSRFFGPAVGINEDPVTGSAHTSLVVYWSKKLKKTKLSARQESKRKGDLLCEINRERALITGNAQLYLKGEIYVPNH
jgi:PhzF family phenazine biosynthesis protein